MLKKITSLLIILLIVCFPKNVFAYEFYSNVNFNTTFDETIDKNDINGIYVYLFNETDTREVDDSEKYIKIVLNSQNNFIDNNKFIPKMDLEIIDIVVDSKKKIDYEVEDIITNNEDGTALINLNVKNYKGYNHDYKLSEEEKEKLNVKTTTSKVDDVTTTIANKNDDSKKVDSKYALYVFAVIGVIVLILLVVIFVKVQKANQ